MLIHVSELRTEKVEVQNNALVVNVTLQMNSKDALPLRISLLWELLFDFLPQLSATRQRTSLLLNLHTDMDQIAKEQIQQAQTSMTEATQVTNGWESFKV